MPAFIAKSHRILVDQYSTAEENCISSFSVHEASIIASGHEVLHVNVFVSNKLIYMALKCMSNIRHKEAQPNQG